MLAWRETEEGEEDSPPAVAERPGLSRRGESARGLVSLEEEEEPSMPKANNLLPSTRTQAALAPKQKTTTTEDTLLLKETLLPSAKDST